jgi:hypothetical protein
MICFTCYLNGCILVQVPSTAVKSVKKGKSKKKVTKFYLEFVTKFPSNLALVETEILKLHWNEKFFE